MRAYRVEQTPSEDGVLELLAPPFRDGWCPTGSSRLLFPQVPIDATAGLRCL